MGEVLGGLRGYGIMNYLLVGIGGMIGSIGRYVLTGLIGSNYSGSKFPVGTFLVNILGCLLIGIVAAVLERTSAFNAEIRLFAITGVLGGFTTFSAFSVETFYLLKSGEIVTTASYAVLSVLLGLAMLFVGIKIAA